MHRKHGLHIKFPTFNYTNPYNYMVATETAKPDYPFLAGGGEMGALTRKFNWSATPVGAPDQWPQSLRTTVSNLLRSRFPMFLWWGPDMIQFYNDAYRPSMGNDGKHPHALGQRGEECWPEIWDIISPLHKQVISNGEATWMEDQLIPIYRNGKIEDVYWTFSYSSVLDDEGRHGGILVTCTETTAKVSMLKQLQVSEQRFHNLVREATTGIVVLIGVEIRVEVVNEAYGKLIGRTPEALLGKNLFDIIPEVEAEFRPLLENVMRTGEPLYLFDQPYKVASGDKTIDGFLNVIYQPYREIDGRISGVLAICQDVSGNVKARKQIEETRNDLVNTILQAPIGICVLDAPTLVSEIVNDSFLEVAGKPYDAVKGKMFWESFAEVRSSYEDALDSVIRNGVAYHAEEVEMVLIRNGKEETIYVTFVYEPLKDDNGVVKKVVVWVVDHTYQVQSRKKVEASSHEVRALVESAPFPIGVYTGREMTIAFANQSIMDVWGKGNEVIGKKYADVLPELENQQIFQQLDQVYTTGVPFHAKHQRVDLAIDGKIEPFYFNYSFTPLFDTSGKVYGVMNTAAVVTDLILAMQQVEQSEENLRNMILQSPVAMCILKGPQHVVEIANQWMLRLWGKTAAQMLNKPVLVGLPELEGLGFDELLMQVYTTGETFRAFAEPVHLERNGTMETAYVNFVYEAMRQGDGSVAGVMVVAIEVTEQVLARQKIEDVVKLRTAELGDANEALVRINQELSRSNKNLEEFAYAASHDLKEPIRKIHFFADRLKNNLTDAMKEEDFRIFSRLETASRRMGTLVDDLLSYSQVSLKPKSFEDVDLNEVLHIVTSELDLEIEQRAAIVTIGKLCVVQGHRRQLQQAFQNLITNALKYSSPDRTPRISLECSRVRASEVPLHVPAEQQHRDFNLFVVRDNGIGFDTADADRIFNVFTRLHGNTDTKGTGVGLSIVRKVIDNHNGYITAEGVVDQGAVFRIYLPA